MLLKLKGEKFNLLFQTNMLHLIWLFIAFVCCSFQSIFNSNFLVVPQQLFFFRENFIYSLGAMVPYMRPQSIMLSTSFSHIFLSFQLYLSVSRSSFSTIFSFYSKFELRFECFFFDGFIDKCINSCS